MKRGRNRKGFLPRFFILYGVDGVYKTYTN